MERYLNTLDGHRSSFGRFSFRKMATTSLASRNSGMTGGFWTSFRISGVWPGRQQSGMSLVWTVPSTTPGFIENDKPGMGAAANRETTETHHTGDYFLLTGLQHAGVKRRLASCRFSFQQSERQEIGPDAQGNQPGAYTR
jgi:hypothetical protein